MDEPRKRGRPFGRRFNKRFCFALSDDMYDELHKIADLANEEATEVVRRMIARQTAFFMYFTSVNKRLPSSEE